MMLSATTNVSAYLRNSSDLPFPRVYTATIVTPESADDTSSRFGAEVDLLSYTKITETTSKISFLVDSKEELIRLRALTKLPSTKIIGRLKIDSNTTSDYRKQMEYKYVGKTTRIASAFSTIADFPCYKNLQGSFAWLDAMVTRASSIPGLNVTKTDIGDSYLKTKNASAGYDIWVLKVTGSDTNGVPAAKKSVFFVMTGIHAREYAPPELASRWLESLINAYGVDADITAMLDYTEIHLVLHSNPDGRQVAETNRAAWRRKNLNPGSGKCGKTSQGVDLNRNFPFRWGLSSGSSSDECSNTYRGPAASSEPEVKAIIGYVASIFPVGQRKANPTAQQAVAYPENTTMGVFLDIHSHGNLFLTPWLHTSTITGNAVGFKAITDKYQFFTKYTTKLGYFASGCTVDYSYGMLGAAGTSVELGNAFYQDCSTFENTIFPKNLKPLTYLAKISKAPFSIAKGPDVTKLTTTVNGNTLSVIATASDSAWSYAKVSTSKQGVREVRGFINTHPYSLATITSSTGHVLNNGIATTISVSSLASGSRNVLYVQATDTAGFRGPVTAAYFTIA
ncbi:metallocarboxypeptidase [Fragilaria crotonensis]|nr:metallocarboxypeptidase [Fragilaria crotonensis]